MEEWLDFYRRYINCPVLERVVERCFELNESMPEFNARRMLLQCKRLVDISEAQENATENSDALKLFFLIVLAENSAKFFDDYTGDGKSKMYVRKFFEEMMPENCKSFLQQNLTSLDQPDDLRYSVDFLYGVRCDVAHEGMYYRFHFKDRDYSLIVEAGEMTASNNMHYVELVKIIVITAYVSIRNKLGI